MSASQNNLVAVVRCEDNSVVAAGTVHFEGDSTGQNGLLIKLEPEIYEPVILYYEPQDTILTVLPGDSVQFIVRAEDPQGDEVSYLWTMDEDTLSADTTVTVLFEDTGEYEVRCFTSDGELTVSICWHIFVREFFLRSFTPDGLTLTVQRGSEVDFSLDAAAVDGPELTYAWTHIGRNQQRQIIGETDSVSFCFDLSGDQRIEGACRRDGESVSATWLVAVRSAVWWWWPHDNELSVPRDTLVDFEIFPFDQGSDSLDYQWFVDGEWFDSTEVTEIEFREVGSFVVTAFVRNGAEADTVSWYVEVFDPGSSADYADYADLPSCPILYSPVPNPFNAETVLNLYVPEAGDIELNLFDMNGRLVKKIVHDRLTQGNHQVVFNALDIPAGVYIFRLKAGGMIFNRKGIVLK